MIALHGLPAAVAESLHAGAARLRDCALPLVLLVLLAAAWQVVPGYRYQINPDGVGYLSAANKYLHGHFGEAVSGYWSPLYCWLLVPLLAAGIAPLLATKVLAVVLGGGVIAAVWRILIQLGVRTDLRVLTGLTLVPVVLWFGMCVITPDLLVCCALLAYLGEIIHPQWLDRRASTVCTGVFGAAAFLAKAYALPFVVVHYLVVGVATFTREKARWRRVLSQWLLGLGVGTALSLPWVTALSLKFHTPTFGSTGSLNHAWSGPKSQGVAVTIGLRPPTDRYAVSAWDDATGFPHESWNPFADRPTRLFQYKLWEKNVAELRRLSESFTWLLYPILAGALLAASKADPAPRRPFWILFAGLLLYPLGYTFLHFEQRFLMVASVLLLVTAAFAVHVAAASRFWSGWGRGLLPMLVIALSFLYQPISDLERSWDTGKNIQTLADALRGSLPEGAAVASDTDWSEALYLAFDLELRYYGCPKSGTPPVAVETELKERGVGYFLVFGNPAAYPWLAGKTAVATGPDGKPKIYQL